MTVGPVTGAAGERASAAAGTPAFASGPAAVAAAPPRPSSRAGPPPATGLFDRYIRGHLAGRFGQRATILHAGCTTLTGLETGALRAAGTGVAVVLVDDDHPAARAAVAARPQLARAVLGDPRTLPLTPRSVDVVLCALLDRIKHAELVMDRLVAALRPGGLLLVVVRDRDSAAGFLDRALPTPARRMIWRQRYPGAPGPYPAVYERLSSVRGMRAYAHTRGLVVAERQPRGGLSGGLPPGPRVFLAAQRLIAHLSGDSLTAAHEEMLFVLRKPANQFARVL